MDIVVLYGGLSAERDVSRSSAASVVRALRESGHRVVPMDLFFGWEGEYSDPHELFRMETEDDIFSVPEKEPDLEAVRASRGAGNSPIGENVLEICRAAELVFLALHGEEGENGKLQAWLDIAGIPYTGSGYLGSALAMNKTLTKQLLTAAGIAVPEGITVTRGEEPYPYIGAPCVVKPCSGGSSVGTSIVLREEDYLPALEAAFAFEDHVIVEKFIQGRELTVGVVDGETLPVVEIIPHEGFYDYRNKYQPGLTEELCPAPIDAEATEQVQRIAKQVCEVLMIEAYGRVDFLMDEEGKFWCLEANTLPGMTPTSLVPRMAAAQGKDFGELCNEIIAASLKKYQ
ncbi:MAG: D-alanine--D-alanine ligase [Eubacteriales bacterium]|nr:D-alanine--D-alanine ligase [Eubacteriales bacterium]